MTQTPATIFNSTLTSAERCQSQFRRPWTSLSKKNTCNGATSSVSEAGETTGKCQGPQEPDDAKTAKKLRPGTQTDSLPLRKRLGKAACATRQSQTADGRSCEELRISKLQETAGTAHHQKTKFLQATCFVSV